MSGDNRVVIADDFVVVGCDMAFFVGHPDAEGGEKIYQRAIAIKSEDGRAHAWVISFTALANYNRAR